MSEHDWVGIEKVAGEFQGEILRGLLEAQGIPVLLSQEGAGRVFGLSVGPLGEVEILVPEDFLQQAQKVLEDYNNGVYATLPEENVQESSTDDEPGDSQSITE